MGGFAAGASASLNKTLGELEDVFRDKIAAAGPLRTELRRRLRSIIAKKAKTWYEIGIARGHTEAYRRYTSGGMVPKQLTVKRRLRFLKSARKQRIEVVSKAR
jgi:hypothetical protein